MGGRAAPGVLGVDEVMQDMRDKRVQEQTPKRTATREVGRILGHANYQLCLREDAEGTPEGPATED